MKETTIRRTAIRLLLGALTILLLTASASAQPENIHTIHLPVLPLTGAPANSVGANANLVGAGSGPSSPVSPKRIILFIGDGMGYEQIKAAGYYLHGAPGGLSFEQFPYQAEMTTFSADNPITDSAASATAMATGRKVNNGVISLAIPGDGEELSTLLEEQALLGKSTGLVSTSYLTDATPAAFGAHETVRSNKREIAADYLTHTRPNVLLGGGGGMAGESAAVAGYTVVYDRAAMLAVDTGAQTHLAGLFGENYMPYEYDGVGNLPHPTEMMQTALAVLDNDPDGFFLMVEGGLIDVAAHKNYLERTVLETVELNRAVAAALEWAAGQEDVLILVLADHETGGLHVVNGGGAGVFPTVTWLGPEHTAQNIPVFATGSGAERVWGVFDNTQIRDIIYGLRESQQVIETYLPIVR